MILCAHGHGLGVSVQDVQLGVMREGLRYAPDHVGVEFSECGALLFSLRNLGLDLGQFVFRDDLAIELMFIVGFSHQTIKFQLIIL